MSKKKFFILLILAFSVSCTSLNRKGYYIDNKNVVNIKEGISHKDNVISILGEPSYKIDENTFLYHSYFENTYGITSTKSYNEEILLLYFDNDGYLNKKVYKNNNLSEFKKNNYKNDIIKKDEQFFRDLFKGVGITLTN